MQSSIEKFRNQARSTLRGVLATGLRTCDDPSSVTTTTDFLAEPRLHFKPRAWGNAQFDVKTEWKLGGIRLPSDQTCAELGGSIEVSATYKNQPLPINVSWSRAYNSILICDVRGVHGSSCPVTADDVGCTLKAEIRAQRGNLGTTYMEVGPFDIDVSMKQSLKNYVDKGFAVFTVDWIRPGHDLTRVKLEVKETDVTIFGDNGETERTLCQSVDARVDVDDATGVVLSFGATEHSLSTMSQRQRDMVVLTIRAFKALKICDFHLLMEQVVKNTYRHSTSESPTTDLDLLIVLEAVSMSAVTAMHYAYKLECEKKAALAERNALEKDIKETLQCYQDLMNQLVSKECLNSATLSKHVSTIESQTSVLKDSRLLQLENQLKQTKTECKSYVQELEQNRSKMKALQDRLIDKEKQLQAWVNDPAQNTEETLGALDLTRQMQMLQTDDFDGDKQLNDARKEIITLKHKINDLEAKYSEVQKDRDFLATQNSQLTETVNYEKKDKTDKTMNFQYENTIIKRDAENLGIKLKDEESRRKETERELKYAIDKISDLEHEVARLKNSVQSSRLHSHMTTLTEPTMVDLETQLLTKTNILAPSSKLQSSKNEMELLKEENEKLRKEKTKLSDEHNDLKQKYRMILTNP